MPRKTIIRSATKKDILHVVEHQANFESRIIPSNKLKTFVVVQGNIVLGFIQSQIKNNPGQSKPTGEIIRFGVRKENQDKGIGKRLFGKTVSYLAKAGAGAIKVFCTPEEFKGQSFYPKKTPMRRLSKEEFEMALETKKRILRNTRKRKQKPLTIGPQNILRPEARLKRRARH